MLLFNTSRTVILFILLLSRHVSEFIPELTLIEYFHNYMNTSSNQIELNDNPPKTKIVLPLSQNKTSNTDHTHKQTNTTDIETIDKIFKHLCHKDVKETNFSECLLTVVPKQALAYYDQKEIDKVLKHNKLYSSIRLDYIKILRTKLKIGRYVIIMTKQVAFRFLIILWNIFS